MHILILPSWYVTSHNPLSGIFFKEQAEALAKQDCKVGIIALSEISIREMDLSIKVQKEVINNVYTIAVEYPSIPKLPSLRRKIKLQIFKKYFKTYVQQQGLPDLIHLHSFEAGGLAVWIKEHYNIPYVVTEHSSGFARELYPLKTLKYSRKIFSNASKRLAVSKQFADLLSKKFNLEFDYLPNIVNTDEFTLKSTRVDTNKFTFINIAFLDKNKNQDMLIKAFYAAFKGKVDVQLIIAGDGPEQGNLQHLINTLNLQDQVTLYGRASRAEVKKLLQSSDAFVLSSQYETFGVVIIEAMSCGLPVVATKCGGPESIISSNELGVLCDTKENYLSHAMLNIYQNYHKFNFNYIQRHIIDNFSEQIIVQKLKNIYKKIINV